MADDPWEVHIQYLEEEVVKTGERADKLEATIPSLDGARKKHEMGELARRLRNEVDERRKFLALVKRK
jgi:hypothetical protein